MIRAMVMAAGAGTRLRPLTFSVPKPMVPIANRPVLEYTLDNLKRHGITEAVLNLYSFPDLIKNHFGTGEKWGMKIHYSHEPVLMGTAGGVKKAEPFLKGDTFLVMSGDGLTDINLTELIEFHSERRAFGTMALKAVDARFEYGVTVTGKHGTIRRFVEKPRWGDVFSNQVNTGIYVFDPAVFKLIPKGKPYDFGHELWPKLLQRKARIFGYLTDHYWCDVGNLSEYRTAQRDILDGKVRIRLPGREIRPHIWVGDGTIVGPEVRLEAPCLIGSHSHIARGAHIGAYTVIGNHCLIGAHANLQNSILWDHVKVEHRVHLQNCVIGHKARVSKNISVYEGAVINISR